MLRTRARLLLSLLLAAFLGFSVTPARSELTSGGKRVALVIGNGDYRNVDRLPNAANDAKLMADTLRGLGFAIVGDGGARLNLDREHLSDAVRDFGHALTGAEVALFYYSGHGLQVKGVNWLVPVDASPASERDLDFQMVDADLVLRQMDGIGTKLNIVLLDACRNNPFAVRGLRALQAGLAEMRAPEGTLISYATQPGNVAVDGAGANSPYTAALAAGMRQPGLDIFRLFNQVGLRVKRTTDGRQQPWVSTSPIDGDFYFAGAPAAPPPLPVAVPPPLPIASAPPAPVASAPPVPVTSVPPVPVMAAPVVRPVPALAPSPTSSPGSIAAAPNAPPAAVVAPPITQAVPPSVTTALLVPPRSAPAPNLGDTVRSAVLGLPCSVLDVRGEANEARLVGLTRGGPAWDNLQRQLNTTRAIRLGTPTVEFLPDFACEVVDVLGSWIRETRLSEDRRLLPPAQPLAVTGETLTVTLRRSAGASVRLDVFQAGGIVQHLAAREERRNGDDTLYAAIWPRVSGGPRLLTAVVSDAPLALSGRPAQERSAAYLAVLREALRAGPGHIRSDLAVFEAPAAGPVANKERVRPVTTPSNVAARPAGRPARCGAILERAQLGEAVSEGDRAFLRDACH
jgi:Caspase domain